MSAVSSLSSATAILKVTISSIRTPTTRSPFRAELVADAKDYLVENLKVEVLSIEGRPAQVELPSSVTLKVTESAQGVRGDSANNVRSQPPSQTGKGRPGAACSSRKASRSRSTRAPALIMGRA